MTAQELRLLIQQTLTPLGLYSTDVEELLMFTAAQESHLGEYRVQLGGGPARGIFQMETRTCVDIWQNFLSYHKNLYTLIVNIGATCTELENNDPYAICMARVQYLRFPESIPDCGDLEAIWALYKLRYNTPGGAATKEEAMANYNKYVLGK